MTLPPQYDEDDRVLAGEYALGLLSPEDARAFEARLTADPQLRAVYAEWAESLADLTDDIDPAGPAKDTQAQIEAQLFGGTSPRRPFAGLRGLGWLVGGAVAAALALYVALNGGLLGEGPTLPGTPDYVAKLAAEDGALLVVAAYDAEKGALLIERRAGAAPEGRALELWLIAGGDAPVSLGVLPKEVDARLMIDAAMGARLADGILAISDEPPGGSPTGAPTGRVLAAGPVTPL